MTSIGSSAFQNCSSLTSVTLPGSVTSIGSSAFQDCSSLTSVTLPGSVTSFGNSAFSGCYDLTNIKVQVNDYSYFCNNVLIGWFKYDIGKSFVLIDDEGIEIKEFIIPEDVTSIGDYAFSGCSGLTSVIIGNSVTSIGDYAFTRCTGLTSVTIPNSVTSIGQYAFNGCSGLTSVTIPNSVTSIADYAFRNCTGLNTITIGSGVTSIGDYAFANIPDLTDVYCYAESVPTASSDIFENSYITGVVLHVPAASVDLYKKTSFWKTFKDIVPIVDVPSEKCATPTIAFANGKLTFECETEGVEYVYSFSSDAFRTSSGSDIPLAGVLHVSVYASKDGCADSDVATIDINLSDVLGDANGDGEITIADITTLINTILGNGNAAGSRAKVAENEEGR